ncbi:Pancreatic lipase-related protein 2 [Halotydeus destructor]|nr:Pancreatic lipase-related protein 2 [Halotydeus destructor]
MRSVEILFFVLLYLQAEAIPETPRQICNRFADQAANVSCNHNAGLCFVSEFSKLVDSCLVGMYFETPNKFKASVTKVTPDRDQFKGLPNATIPPADFRQFHPLYGTMSGYEEPNYHLGMLPQDPSVLRTHLVYHTPMGVYNISALTSHMMLPMIQPQMQPKYIFIVSHDFNNAYQTNQMLMNLVTSLMNYEPNHFGFRNPVIMVDSEVGFKAGLNGTFYKQAAANAILIGRQVGAFIFQLTQAGIHPFQIHLIGYGLGAQMLHFAARWYTQLHMMIARPQGFLARVGRLTGLDPVAAHFEGFRPQFGESPHIMMHDARRVDVITTSSGANEGLDDDPLFGSYGMATEVAMRHFYPNAGHTQPGCEESLESPVIGSPGRFEASLLCNHRKALQYFTYSLLPHADRELLTAKRSGYWDEYVERSIEDNWDPAKDFAEMGIRAFDDDRNFQDSFYISVAIDNNYQASAVDVLEQADRVEAMKGDTRLLKVPPFYDSEETFTEYPIHAVPAVASHPRDAPSCGKFRSKPSDSRIFRGQMPYEGQFPWVVCMLTYDRMHWGRACTGAILSESFILIAAHCFEGLEKGTPIYVTFGANDCLKPPPDMFRKVIFDYQNTVLVWPEYESDGKYDVGLIRLVDPIKGLPKDTYNGELVNSICFHANQHYGDLNWSEYIYVAGFGTKGNAGHDNSELTWTYSYRTANEIQQEYADVFESRLNTSLIDHYMNRKWYTTCGGDSGASYAWYINTQDEHKDNVSDYRAVTVSIVKSGIESCDFRYYNILTGLGIGADNAVNLRHEDTYNWIADKMDDDYSFEEVPEESPDSYLWMPPPFAFDPFS